MPWARLDDTFHAHPKVRAVWAKSPAAIGLHSMALSYCAGLLTDGFIDAQFVSEKMPQARTRLRATDVLVEAGLWDKAPGGWQIHDWFEFNDSRQAVESRRARDRSRKRNPAEPAEDSARNPADVPLGFQAPPPRAREGTRPQALGRDGCGVGEVHSIDAHVRARSASPKIQAVLDKLAEAPRLFVDAIAVENAIGMYPSGDPMMAAQHAVQLGRDPSYRLTNAATLMSKWLERQATPKTPTPFTRDARRPSAADFDALIASGELA